MSDSKEASLAKEKWQRRKVVDDEMELLMTRSQLTKSHVDQVRIWYFSMREVRHNWKVLRKKGHDLR